MTDRPPRPPPRVVRDAEYPSVDVGRLRLRGDVAALCRIVRTGDFLSAWLAVEALDDIGVEVLDEGDRSAVVGTLLWCLEELQNDVDVYGAAARALGRLGERRALPLLLRLLNYEYTNISEHQEAAAWALGELRDPAAIPALIESMTNPSVGEISLVSLARIGSVEAVEPILSRFDDSWWYPGQAAAARTLGELGDRRACPTLSRLLSTSPRSDVRRAAAKALGRIGGQDAVAPLIVALSDPDEQTAIEARDALGSIAEAMSELRKAFRSSNPVVRAGACHALGRLGLPDSVEVLAETLRSDGSSAARAAAAGALGRIGGAAARSALLEGLNDSRIIEAAAPGLAGLDDPPVDRLAALLEHGTEAERQGAATALGIIGDRWYVNKLIGAVNDNALRVSRAAIEALGKIKDGRALDTLLMVVQDSEQPGTLRARAAAALGSLGDAQASDVLLEALAEGPPSLRLRAAEALGYLKVQEAVPKLLKVASRDSDAEVRAAAAAALASIGPAAEDALVSLLGRVSVEERVAAIRLLDSDLGDRLVIRLGKSVSASDPNERVAATAALGRSGNPLCVKALKRALNIATKDWLRAESEEVSELALDGLSRFDDQSVIETVLHQYQSPFGNHEAARRALNAIACRNPNLPRRNLDAGLAGGRLRRSVMARISSYFRSL